MRPTAHLRRTPAAMAAWKRRSCSTCRRAAFLGYPRTSFEHLHIVGDMASWLLVEVAPCGILARNQNRHISQRSEVGAS